MLPAHSARPLAGRHVLPQIRRYATERSETPIYMQNKFRRVSDKFITYRPRTPGVRHVRLPYYPHLYRGRVYLPLTIPYHGSGGRDRNGRISVRGRGGGHRRRLRIVDFTRQDWPEEGAEVLRIEHDPGRNAHIALVKLLGPAKKDKISLTSKKTRPALHNGFRYIIATNDMRAGDKIYSHNTAAPILPTVDDLESIGRSREQLREGNTVPLGAIPNGTVISAVSLRPGGKAQLSRSAGTGCTLVGRDQKGCHIQLPSGEIRYLDPKCTASIGKMSNPNHYARIDGKAGRRRWLGRRPIVRGIAMNRVDHPRGGGRGKSKSNKHPVTKWGKKVHARTRRPVSKKHMSSIHDDAIADLESPNHRKRMMETRQSSRNDLEERQRRNDEELPSHQQIMYRAREYICSIHHTAICIIDPPSKPRSPLRICYHRLSQTPIAGHAMTSRPQTPQPGQDGLRYADAAQHQLFSTDPRFRKHTAAVEKVLSSFENVNEWADFITFLSRLLKTLQASPTFPFVPHTLTVSKRLAQCLNPALPTGVHQRALDVYAHIFSLIGVDGLKRDFPAWSNGLLPFFAAATTGVRPIILNILIKYYLPLQRSLRPATKALILALLPGLEEVNSDIFEKVASVFDSISLSVDPVFFIQTVFLTIITNPDSRLPALNYINRRLPETGVNDSLSPIIGSDVGLLTRGYAAALQDSQMLVQRAALDGITATLPVHSNAFQNEVRPQGRLYLMLAALSVVLRRDLSLSRRLHAWLLGPDTDPDGQIEYLEKYSLEIVSSAIKNLIKMPSDGLPERQSAFRILISLLDKWEIGLPLTNTVIIDVFSSVFHTMQKHPSDEALKTANMLFDALDPFVMWRNFFHAIEESMLRGSENDQVLQYTSFVLASFPQREEEAKQLHFPLIFFSLLQMIESIVHENNLNEYGERLLSASQVLQHLSAHLSPCLFSSDPSTTDENFSKETPLTVAREVYAVDLNKTSSKSRIEVSTQNAQFLSSGKQLILNIVNRLATLLLSLSKDGEQCSIMETPSLLSSTYLSMLPILTVILSLDVPHGCQLSWNPEEFSGSMLQYIQKMEGDMPIQTQFDLIQRSNDALIALFKSNVTPAFFIDTPPVMSVLVTKILSFLHSAHTFLHSRAVETFWILNQISTNHHPEEILCQSLKSPNVAVNGEAYESFTILWRRSDDSQKPWVTLQRALLTVLDSLESKDVLKRKAAETWMRCATTSYLRIVDGLLGHLLHPTINRQRITVTLSGASVTLLQYEGPIDQMRILSILRNLLSTVRYAGSKFNSVAKATIMQHTPDDWLRNRMSSASLESSSYLDGLCVLLTDFIRSDQPNQADESSKQLNDQIHGLCIDVLQVLLPENQIEISALKAVEDTIISRLFICATRKELSNQNNLLHILPTIIKLLQGASKDDSPNGYARRSSVDNRSQLQKSTPETNFLPHPLLTRTIMNGLTMPDSGLNVQHWVDFVLSMIPLIQSCVIQVVSPLVDCIHDLLQDEVYALARMYKSKIRIEDFKSNELNRRSFVTESTFKSMLQAYEMLLFVAIDAAPDLVDSTPPAAQEKNEGSRLFGYVGNVFGSSEIPTQNTETMTKGQRMVQQKLVAAVKIIIEAWTMCQEFSNSNTIRQGVVETSPSNVLTSSGVLMKKLFENLFKRERNEVFEAVILHWHAFGLRTSFEDPLCSSCASLLEDFSLNAQPTIRSLSECIMARSSPATGEKHPSYLENPDVNAEMLFAFLEDYFKRVDTLTAVQIWSVSTTLFREILNNPAISHDFIVKSLVCFAVYVEKVSRTSALHDRRLRRELQDTFLRLFESAIGEPAARPSTPIQKELPDTEKNHRPQSPQNSVQVTRSHLVVISYVHVVPSLNRLMVESEKSSSACHTIIQQLVSPLFKPRNRVLDVDETLIRLIVEISKAAPSLKSWKNVVNDIIYDGNFFKVSTSVIRKWKPAVRALMASDRERFQDLLAKISTTQSVNIFTNKDYEMTARAASVRRLCYAIFSEGLDAYLVQLPGIHEKLVELLRANVGERVHREVYLCLRVLLRRVSPVHLSSFWPVILTELLQLFEKLMGSFTSENRDYVLLILSACKFLDLLLVLQTEDFQIHEWMFVTDTTDAVYPPEDEWAPEAIMDRLADILSKHTTVQSHNSREVVLEPRCIDYSHGEKQVLRRPMLTDLRSSDVTSLSTLEPFFERASWMTYENVYSGSGVDVEEVERSIEMDMAER